MNPYNLHDHREGYMDSWGDGVNRVNRVFMVNPRDTGAWGQRLPGKFESYVQELQFNS